MFGNSVRLTALVWVTGAAALAQCQFPRSGPGRVVKYTFQPAVTHDATVLHVTLEFQGGPHGIEEIEIPEEWAGEKLHGIINLRAISQGTVIRGTMVGYRRNKPVVLTYDIVKDWTGPFNHPFQFRGVVLPEYIELTGDNALVHPKLKDRSHVTVNFDWQKIPDNWILATSFGTRSCQTYSGSWMNVLHGLYTAGQFRLHHFQIGARPAVLAIRGDWSFTDEQAIGNIQKVVGAVRDFWHDDNFPYFLITLKPYEHERGSGDGSAFTNAFWLYMSRLDPFSTQLTQLAHESFHAWNPGKMGDVPDEKKINWFREGFTTYYAYLLVQKAGLMPLADYVDGINGDLRNYPTSQDPYLRGRVIALWLDGKIRDQSKRNNSLDNLMFDMVREAGKPLTEARILETAGRYLTPEARVQFDQIVHARAEVAPADDALGPCAHVVTEELPSFDLGFDFAASIEAHKLTAVRPDGPAFKAGLREGQPLSGWSVHNNQPDQLARMTITTEDGNKTKIEYYPRGMMITVPQYHMVPECPTARN
jgi:predicted metalloprotease with PDZ domain